MSKILYTPLREWWEELVDDDHKGQCAKLRRCKTPEEILLNSDYIRLKQKMSGQSINGLEVIAGLLAFVKDDGRDTNEKLAAQMAGSIKDTDRPRISEIRFRRLLQCETRDELYHLLSRVIKMLGNTSSNINIEDLIKSIHYWSRDSTRRKHPKKQWAEAYYSKLPSK